MALVSLRQLLDHAAENSYGMPAFNVNNMEQVHAIMNAADEAQQSGYHAGFCRCSFLCGGALLTPPYTGGG